MTSKKDRHHNEAVKIIKNIRPLKVSPYAFLELDLLIISGKIEVKIPIFYEASEKTFSYYDIEVVKPSLKHLMKGWELREKYNLTYFDSLHASTAVVENETLVSYDNKYSDIKELKYLRPEETLRISEV